MDVHKDNPEVSSFVSDVESYGNYTLEKAYQGKTMFRGRPPQEGDKLVINFAHPASVKT